MTVEEMGKALRGDAAGKLSEVAITCGLEASSSVDKVVDRFVKYPEYERKIAHILEIPTEEEKRTQAQLDSTRAARA